MRSVGTLLMSLAAAAGNKTRLAPLSKATCRVSAKSSIREIVPPIVKSPRMTSPSRVGFPKAMETSAISVASEM